MEQRWLKHEDDGYIFGWTPGLAAHPKLREVSKEEAFPDKYAPKKLVAKAKRRTKKKPGLDLSTSDIPAPPDTSNPELSQDASKGLPE